MDVLFIGDHMFPLSYPTIPQGPIAGGLLNNYEARNVVVAGTVLSSIAFVLSTFSPNIFFHYFLYGILGGQQNHSFNTRFYEIL
jgi:hypothetical protein